MIDPTAIIGPAAAIDGDTIRIGEERIRLYGIDAPELDQECGQVPCGIIARHRLAGRIGETEVECRTRGRDQYQRLVGVCLAEGEDLALFMVQQGWAFAAEDYSEDYLLYETVAQAAGNGLWSLTFVNPEDWRRQEQFPVIQPEANGDCPIKGNINREGERIYHTPGMSSYARTQIDVLAGERWFCSEAEAQAAGWRTPR